MATATFYPTSVTSAIAGFTAAQLANVLGNTTTYAVHTAAVAVNGGIGGTFAFDLSSLPSNIVINSIQFSLIAKASATSRRTAYSVDMYGAAGNSIIKTMSVPLLTTDTTASVTMTGAELTAAGWTVDEIRTAAIEWTGTFISSNATSTTTSWQKFIITVDYTVLASVNTLFFGELF
jgi:hypothetical protein